MTKNNGLKEWFKEHIRLTDWNEALVFINGVLVVTLIIGLFLHMRWL